MDKHTARRTDQHLRDRQANRLTPKQRNSEIGRQTDTQIARTTRTVTNTLSGWPASKPADHAVFYARTMAGLSTVRFRVQQNLLVLWKILDALHGLDG